MFPNNRKPRNYLDRDDSNLTVEQLIGLPFVIIIKILKKTALDQGINFNISENHQDYNKNEQVHTPKKQRSYYDKRDDRNRPNNNFQTKYAYEERNKDSRRNQYDNDWGRNCQKYDNQDQKNLCQRNIYSEKTYDLQNSSAVKSFEKIPQKDKEDSVINQPIFEQINSCWDSMSYSQKFQFE